MCLASLAPIQVSVCLEERSPFRLEVRSIAHPLPLQPMHRGYLRQEVVMARHIRPIHLSETILFFGNEDQWGSRLGGVGLLISQ